ncbi:MAG: hypothetical protein RR585_13275 [Coprobacillus sp.]
MGFSGILMVLGGTSLIESTFLQIKDMQGIAPGVTSPIATGYIGMFD